MIKRVLLLVGITALSTLIARAQSIPAQPVAGRSDAGTPASSATFEIPLKKKQPVGVTRFKTPPVIDGNLDEEVWKQGATLDNFYQTYPGDNSAPSQPTTLKIGYDEKYFYLAFDAVEEAGKVRATIAKRDNVLEDDYVSVYLDTFNDQRKAYVFTFNPLGVQQDGILTEGGGENYSLDIVMQSQGRVTEKGYSVEVAIPFKSLRYIAGADKQWGIQVFRRIKHLNNEQSSWMPIFRDKSGFLSQEGRITGLEGIASERTIEIIPSLTLSETGKRTRALPQRISPNDPVVPDPGRFVNKPLAFDPGLTAKFGISSKVTLDFALNPDFAQVEADEIVVTANQRFPIFFEEKRPFFLEGSDIFRTLITVVHTRAIIDPDIAIKLTGKHGRNTFGLLLASDNAPGNFSQEERDDPGLRPSIERFLDKNAYIGVLRLKRDVGKENSLGFIATTYNFIEKHNNLGGFDGRFRLDPQTIIQFQVVGTTSRRFFRDPDLGRNIYRTGNGFSYSFLFQRTGRNFSAELSGVGRTRDYRADVGFTRRTNTNNQQLGLRYDSDPQPKAKLVSWHIFNQSVINYDWQGRSQLFNINSQASFNFQRQAYFGAGYQRGYERLREEEFGNNRTQTRAGAFAGPDPERSTYRNVFYAYAGATPSKKYSLAFEALYTLGALDFDFGGGPKFPRASPAALTNPLAPLDPGPGNELLLTSSFVYQPTDALRLSLDYTKDRLTRNDTKLVAFDDNIYSLRTTYQFSRFTFARARVDYDTLATRVRGQFLLGWTPSPGTSFYAGYNDDLNRNGFNSFTGQLEPGFRRNGRTFFIKMSYLFRRSF
jgi:hypothetical protein